VPGVRCRSYSALLLLLPNETDWVLLKRGVTTHNGHSLRNCLCDDEPIERISVVKRHLPLLVQVLRLNLSLPPTDQRKVWAQEKLHDGMYSSKSSKGASKSSLIQISPSALPNVGRGFGFERGTSWKEARGPMSSSYGARV
jgi:hypothetical protein